MKSADEYARAFSSITDRFERLNALAAALGVETLLSYPLPYYPENDPDSDEYDPELPDFLPQFIGERYATMSSGERASVLFSLYVWNPDCLEILGLPPFDLKDALCTWDPDRLAAFAAWSQNPFWG